MIYIDPPYNSRQYCRFYHVYENLVKWDKPILSGVAMKPPAENMSKYCTSKAPEAFSDLVKNLDANIWLFLITIHITQKAEVQRIKSNLKRLKKF